MDSVLVIDDEKNIRALLAKVLSQDQVEVYSAGTGAEGMQMADEHEPDLVLLDLRLPDTSGLEVLRLLRARHPEAIVIMMTAFGQVESAVEAIKSGATDYLEKPFDRLDKLRVAVGRALEESRARREIHRLRELQEKMYGADRMVGDSSFTRGLRDLIRQLAASEAQTILVQGETGTGKELVARALHYGSARRELPLIEVNCAAIPDTLFESELFGHEKGAFTGATDQKKGRFELADGGTILIDGVSELQPSLQGKLLRVVQERSFERLAGTRTISVDVRILASTQADLEALVLAGSFRKDLFYRLNVIRIEIPPLRDRLEDVPVLAQQVLLEIARKAGAPPKRLTKGALDRLIRHAWPGNVRELQNVLESAAILEDGAEIPAEAVRVGDVRPASPVAAAVQKLCSLAQIEEAYIREVLRITGNNRSEAARILGINRKTLLEKRKRYGIP
ncbi:MAG TPA: sigma-54 dependent transcriptional regulator [Candidatus Dormibacteraeota bacterium]|nr:sigma-54 dependent transcriptional regulator [Candidatus Dormibacteraeota bacterium]